MYLNIVFLTTWRREENKRRETRLDRSAGDARVWGEGRGGKEGAVEEIGFLSTHVERIAKSTSRKCQRTEESVRLLARVVKRINAAALVSLCPFFYAKPSPSSGRGSRQVYRNKQAVCTRVLTASSHRPECCDSSTYLVPCNTHTHLIFRVSFFAVESRAEAGSGCDMTVTMQQGRGRGRTHLHGAPGPQKRRGRGRKDAE